MPCPECNRWRLTAERLREEVRSLTRLLAYHEDLVQLGIWASEHGIKRQTAHLWSRTEEDFPQPCTVVQRIPYYRREELEAWKEIHRPDGALSWGGKRAGAGRPRKRMEE
jgi:hypothetical protein